MSRTGWRCIAVILAGAFVAAAVTGTGAASRAGKVYTLSGGDGLVIVGSRIQCGVAADSGYGLDLRGKIYVVCGPSTQVKGGGYVALMASDGHVYILSIKTHKTVSSRVPAAAVRKAGLYTARLGDRVAIKGTSLLCDVIKVSGVATLLCDYVDSKGVTRANSFAFGLSDVEVTSLEWDPSHHVHILKSWPER